MVFILVKFLGDKFFVCFGGFVIGEKGLLLIGFEYLEVVEDVECGEFFKLILFFVDVFM